MLHGFFKTQVFLINDIINCKQKNAASFFLLIFNILMDGQKKNSMNDIHHQNLGRWGEEMASQFLMSKGYVILHRNWHFAHKELDIVARLGETIAIVEVKTRTSNFWEEPKEAVKRKKQKRIIEAADAYIRHYNLDFDVRFDIVSVLKQGNSYSIEHIEDAFYPIL